ncbi:lysine N(6)-hydroxylase/L-ornithine N(5)-oxygenase family protein [Angustibacter luteus]|uniref:L-lysine N6-monooxygenase MbtG n=1 Tax=Angustibacter luteus TaxID=658456 RepID=A0ABW1JDB5_9ACTN
MSTPTAEHVHDVVGIGLGPFNLGLACLLDPLDDVDAVFLEARSELAWHPGMLLQGATLQTPFLADLVSLANPTSPLSFLSYLKQTGRLYPFYIRESFFPLRREFDAYCRWAAGQLRSVRLAQRVESVEYDAADQAYVVHAVRPATGDRSTYRGRRLVLGTGTPPYVPEPLRAQWASGGDVVHSSQYLQAAKSLRRSGSITVVGSGQSAAEIYADLLADLPAHDYQLTWLTRSPRFFPLEYTKLTLEMTSPDYTDYFHALPAETRDGLVRAQRSLYKGINSGLVNEIYDRLYELDLDGPQRTRLLTNTEVRTCERDGDGRLRLGVEQVEQRRRFEHTTGSLVLATGYRYAAPAFLDPIRHRIRWDEQGRFAVHRNYSVDVAGDEVFVQNAELHTHGFVAPDLGMAAYRNSWLVRSITGREVYPIEQSIAHQEFGVPRPLDVREPLQDKQEVPA